MHEDAALLRRYAETRAEDAFAELVRRHVDAVYSAALRRVGNDTHLAEDVTQHVFVALARRAAIVARHPHLTGWLYITTRNEAANAVRTERRRKAREQEAFIMQESTFEPAAEVQWSRIAPLIDREIDRLNDRDRAAVLLRFIENRTFSEIGAALQLTEDAARMRLDRALEKLRVSLARRGIASTSAALGAALANHAVAAAPANLAANATSGAVAAATSGAWTAGFLQLMISAKVTTGFVGFALLLATFTVATYEIHRSRDAAAALASARENDVALAARLRLLNEQSATAEREVTQLQRQLQDAADAAAESARRAAAAAAKAAAWNSVAEGEAFMNRHPGVRQALLGWVDAQTNFKWSAFYEEAGLTQSQIEEFQKLKREGFGFGRSAIAGLPQLDFLASAGISWNDADGKLRTLLGADGYQKYQNYFQTIPARELGSQVASALTFTPTPLTAAQFEELTQTIAKNHAAGYSANGAHYDWPAITKSAQEILSSAQLTVLEGLRSQAEFNEVYSQAANALAKVAANPRQSHTP